MTIGNTRHPSPVPMHSLRRSRDLRRTMTVSEHRLWHALRGRRLGGARFARQYVIGDYIVDFVCRQHRMVVELDGDQHGRDEGLASDRVRTAFLEQRGYRVLRIWNVDIMENLDGVLQTIAMTLDAARDETRP
jgi:very-short-patch-repair endonuclease